MYSSSTLDHPARSGCWKTLDFYEQGADSLFPLMYRSYLGQAAHAVMQYCAERKCETEAQYRKTGEEVGNLLISKGRTFRGREEPPLPPDEVWAGVDIANDYLMGRGLPLDVDLLWTERKFNHPTLPYQALIDLVYQQTEGDEEYEQTVWIVRDYKTSWQAGEDELNTLQRWGQAIVMWRNLEDFHLDVDVIRQEVVNLRTWQSYERDIRLDDDDDIVMLEQWESRIEGLCNTADAMKLANDGKRPATPGAGCLSCAYRHICEEVWPIHDTQGLSPNELATELAIIEGQRSMMLSILKIINYEGALSIDGGYVGYKEQERRIFRPGTEKHLLSDWFEAMATELPEDVTPALTSLLSALKLSKGNLDAFAKALYPQRMKGIGEQRDNYVEGITDVKRFGQFGVWAKEAGE